ncbi:hypothetical protein C8J57DRAFT_1550068 [Mycena rebaudengoi]|nr:hypothetical protein C8J57DRAFT_1550068 [Mycena rebaudengoi]
MPALEEMSTLRAGILILHYAVARPPSATTIMIKHDQVNRAVWLHAGGLVKVLGGRLVSPRALEASFHHHGQDRYEPQLDLEAKSRKALRDRPGSPFDRPSHTVSQEVVGSLVIEHDLGIQNSGRCANYGLDLDLKVAESRPLGDQGLGGLYMRRVKDGQDHGSSVYGRRLKNSKIPRHQAQELSKTPGAWRLRVDLSTSRPLGDAKAERDLQTRCWKLQGYYSVKTKAGLVHWILQDSNVAHWSPQSEDRWIPCFEWT